MSYAPVIIYYGRSPVCTSVHLARLPSYWQALLAMVVYSKNVKRAWGTRGPGAGIRVVQRGIVGLRPHAWGLWWTYTHTHS